MISPSSALGMLASWICLTATVSPFVKLSAPSDGPIAKGGSSALGKLVDGEQGERTIDRS